MSDHTIERRLDKDGCPYLFIKSPCGHELGFVQSSGIG